MESITVRFGDVYQIGDTAVRLKYRI